MTNNMKPVPALVPGDKFVRHHDYRLMREAAPVYTVQSVRKFGFDIFVYCDRGLVRANAAGSVLTLN